MPADIRFDDAAAYEKMMGVWSRIVGEKFLDWLQAPPQARWVDVGCGTGAFTELILDRCAPAEVQGFDPSERQVAYARSRAATRRASLRIGDALQAPYTDASFDIAVMALVIFFLTDPARGVAEMVRLVRPGGIVCAYVWDVPGAGQPHASLTQLLREAGHPPPRPPHHEVSSVEGLRSLWMEAGLDDVQTQEITVQRSFRDFDDMWETTSGSPSIVPVLQSIGPAVRDEVKRRWREQIRPDAAGRTVLSAKANAVKGKRAWR